MTEARRVDVVDYSKKWPIEFREERDRLIGAIGSITRDIRHVGSTSIPGMTAKPIIDIAVGLVKFGDGASCVAPLQRLGYESRGEYGIPGRHYFVKGSPSTRHLHMYAESDPRLLDYILFRDYLIAHPDPAIQYAALKRDLAGRFGDDRASYQDGKAAFVESVLEKARGTL